MVVLHYSNQPGRANQHNDLVRFSRAPRYFLEIDYDDFA